MRCDEGVGVRTCACAWRRAIGAVVAIALAASLALAQKPAEVHGSLDAYAGGGVAMAWGVLRAKDEAATEVVVRVDVDPAAYGSFSVVGIDPFTRQSQPLIARTPVAGSYEFRQLRSRFADFPRTEWRFFAPSASAGDPPALLVYFQGVPDTTPEFNDGARMRADLARRLDRARQETKGRP
jgi:hypothetical protein